MVNSAKTFRFAVIYTTREPERERLITEYFRTATEAANRIGCTRNTIFNMLQGKRTRLGMEYQIKRVHKPTERAVPMPSLVIDEPDKVTQDA